MKTKSILDGVIVEDKAFPLKASNDKECMVEVVSSCPHCGAPIYGQKWITTSEDPRVTHTCNCRLTNQKSIQDSMHTK